MSRENSEPTSEASIVPNNKSIKNGFLFILFTGASFLTFNIGGYNNFVPSELRLIVRIIVAGILFLSTVALYKTEGSWNKYWNVSYALLISSIGLVLAWFFGRWYTLIPGLSLNTVEGVAIAKVAEVIPIVVTILIGTWLVERDFTPIFLRGGDLEKTFKIGLIVSPVALIPFFALGGLGLSVGLDVISRWLPWMCVFGFSNAFMEELMIRGIFLKKYNAMFGKNSSLLLTSVIFALFHQAVIDYTDPASFTIFLLVTFLLGISWGYVMQKSDSIWGAVLAHAIADILLIIAVFGT
ncbi:MAG: CPBP family intramembrane metalloprotease [Candidatus Thorarchaeota archaeon]|nr:CPBP family intramembrane metalloprotease [Candidatus Thorarchaeota archaeon]